eukprot:352891-Chlamydomonas_euryale.AAC.6
MGCTSVSLQQPYCNRGSTAPADQLPVAGHELPVAGHELPVAGHELPVAGHELPVAGHEQEHADHFESGAGRAELDPDVAVWTVAVWTVAVWTVAVWTICQIGKFRVCCDSCTCWSAPQLPARSSNGFAVPAAGTQELCQRAYLHGDS